MFKRVSIFSGNANPALTTEICQALELPLGKSEVSRFSDGETSASIQENVRGVDTYVVQPTCSPVNDNVMELLIMVDALRRASAGSITAVIPYYGYARQDRKVAPRTPITPSWSPTSSSPPASTASSRSTCTPRRSRASSTSPSTTSSPCRRCSTAPPRATTARDCVIVSPDAGGVERARAYSKRLDGTLAIIDKRRERANESEVMNIIGEVEGQDAASSSTT